MAGDEDAGCTMAPLATQIHLPYENFDEAGRMQLLSNAVRIGRTKGILDIICVSKFRQWTQRRENFAIAQIFGLDQNPPHTSKKVKFRLAPVVRDDSMLMPHSECLYDKDFLAPFCTDTCCKHTNFTFVRCN